MNRLSVILTLLSGALISGALVVAAFSMGYDSWWVLGGVALIGWLMAWPSALIVARRIKERGPEWSTHTKSGHKRSVYKPDSSNRQSGETDDHT
ncbi:hypothetical protein [Marivita sp. S2033]|uniref:hypothetical protein n=1 Tax=Marivita sp. S2033 TaxID=3373187 RepID=UPI00398231C5